MKKIFLVLALLILSKFYAQTYYKTNALTNLLLIPSVGVETSIGNKLTFQLDVTASFWKSIQGRPFEAVLVFPEVRYHFHEKFNGWYAGAHIGGGKYKLTKWDHWNSNQYEEGYNYMIGATLGYEKKIGAHWLIDVFLGGGNSQGFYKGYDLTTGIRYDGAKDWNKSGETLPYRGGVLLGYTF